METIAHDINRRAPFDHQPATDGNRQRRLAFGSALPSDAVARIFRPSRSVMTSGRARTKGWKLVFERRTPHVIEPLMGWTGGDDTLTQVELTFPTREAALAYAERQGLLFVVQGGSQPEGERRRVTGDTSDEQALAGMLSADLAFAWLQTRYGIGGPSAPVNLERALLHPVDVLAGPADVVADPALTVESKRQILRSWAWQEYLADLATTEGMLDGGRLSRLDEVNAALLALEDEGRATSGITVRRDAPELRHAA
ncbi:ETC complex I subunit conserved region [Rhizobiales bacterium GAS113]|nr:ETC complex I subunit conserved region [Rhizobiales bacterium GAS113]